MNRTTYQKAMQQISASEEEIRMKAKQIQAQYNTNKKIRRSAGRRKLFAGLAAAAAIMIGGTITVGALNDWNYSSLMNRYFKRVYQKKIYPIISRYYVECSLNYLRKSQRDIKRSKDMAYLAWCYDKGTASRFIIKGLVSKLTSRLCRR